MWWEKSEIQKLSDRRKFSVMTVQTF